MSGTMALLTAGEAQRLTQRIKLTSSSVRDGLFKLRNLVEEAKNSNVWQILGFPSWPAYLADTLADEPMRLGRDERQELVGYLAGEGLSTRAIAPIVGVSHQAVANDISGVKKLTPETDPRPHASGESRDEATGVDGPPTATPVADLQIQPQTVMRVNPATGEVEDVPARHVTGLDGKDYSVPTRKPKPEPARKPSTELSLINDIRLYLGALASSPQVAQLSPLGREHIITALRNAITQIERNAS